MNKSTYPTQLWICRRIGFPEVQRKVKFRVLVPREIWQKTRTLKKNNFIFYQFDNGNNYTKGVYIYIYIYIYIYMCLCVCVCVWNANVRSQIECVGGLVGWLDFMAYQPLTNLFYANNHFYFKQFCLALVHSLIVKNISISSYSVYSNCSNSANSV